MGYTVVPTITTGDVATSAWGNTHIKDNFAAGVPDLFTTADDGVYADGSDSAVRRAKITQALAEAGTSTVVGPWAPEQVKQAIAALGLANVVEDLSPQWGADIDFNGFDASGIGHLGFLASQDASAGANDLDDYQEATFTPTLQDNSRDDNSQTATTAVGWSTKIGNIFQFGITFESLSLGTLGTGEGAVLAGLPVTSQNTANHRSGVSIGLGQQLAITAGQTVSGYMNPNETVVHLYLWDAGGGETALLISEFSANGLLYLGGAYETA